MGDVAKKAFNMISKKATKKKRRSKYFYLQATEY